MHFTILVIYKQFCFSGHNSDGKAIYLKDIWPSREEIQVSLYMAFCILCSWFGFVFFLYEYINFQKHTNEQI